MMFTKVLLSSCAGKVPLFRAVEEAVLRVHPDASVVPGDSSDTVLLKYISKNFWRMPPVNESYIEDIIEGCRRRGVTTVLPTRDGELLFWAKHKSQFKRVGIEVLVSPCESLRRCIDKLIFSKFGLANGWPFICTEKDINKLSSERFVVKERFGAGSKSIGIDLSLEAALEHARSLQEPIFQPYIIGKEISVDSWVDKSHKVKGVVLRHRQKVVNGESQVTSSFRDRSLEDLITNIIEGLELNGPIVLQAIIDEMGGLHIIECNARFGGASTLSLSVGLDSIYWSLIESLGEDVSRYPFIRRSEDIRQIRVSTDIYTKVNDIDF